MTWTKQTQIHIPLVTSCEMLSWLCTGVVWKMTIFCKNYAWIHVLMCLMIVKLKFWTVAVMCPLFQQSWHHPCVSTSDNDTRIHKEESSELDSSDKTSDVWCKTDKQPAANLSFEPQVWIQLLRKWVPSLVMILHGYLPNSLIFTIVETHNKVK